MQAPLLLPPGMLLLTVAGAPKVAVPIMIGYADRAYFVGF
jgi:hypothetical protein